MEQKKDNKKFISDINLNLEELDKLFNLLDPEEQVFSNSRILIKEMNFDNNKDDLKDNNKFFL